VTQIRGDERRRGCGTLDHHPVVDIGPGHFVRSDTVQPGQYHPHHPTVAHNHQVTVGVGGKQFIEAGREAGVELTDGLAARRGGIGVDHPTALYTEMSRAHEGMRGAFGGAQATFTQPTVVSDRPVQQPTDW